MAEFAIVIEGQPRATPPCRNEVSGAKRTWNNRLENAVLEVIKVVCVLRH